MIVADVTEHVHPIDRAAERRDEVEALRVVRADEGRSARAHRDAGDAAEDELALAGGRLAYTDHELVGAGARRQEGDATWGGLIVGRGDGHDARLGRAGAGVAHLDHPPVSTGGDERELRRDGEGDLAGELLVLGLERDRGAERDVPRWHLIGGT